MSARGFLAALAFASLAVTACTPGVQPLLDEYNALFGKVTERGQGAVTEDDGTLKDSYGPVPNDYTLNLHAPEHCSSYQWTVVVADGYPDVKLPADFDVMNYGGNTIWLRLDLKKAGFMIGNYVVSYEAVRGTETLKDSCIVMVRLPKDESDAGGAS